MSTRLEEYHGAPELTGEMVYEQDWYLLRVTGGEATTALTALLEPFGAQVKPAARLHVSTMKNEAPSRNRDDWGVAFTGEVVTVRYHPVLRDTNGLHLWVDCHSLRLCAMREHFGLPTLRRGDGAYLVNFHLTVGRRRRAVDRPRRPELRLTPQSHIDVETGMQHL